MSEKLQVYCDGPNCGIAKKETNHWFAAAVVKAVNERPPAIIVVMSDRKEFLNSLDKKEIADCCGENCLSRVIQSWAEKRYLEALELKK